MSFLSLGQSRSIESISGYITINESTADALEITQQPVQQGATITDHAFLKPTTLSVQIRFAQAGLTDAFSASLQSAIFGNSSTNSANGSLSETYQKLLDLQSSLAPFSIITPKRVYNNMLFQTLGVTTDKQTENVLAVSATFLQIIIVSVTTTLVPRSKLRNAGKHGGTQNAGKKSALLTGASGITPGIKGFTQ